MASSQPPPKKSRGRAKPPAAATHPNPEAAAVVLQLPQPSSSSSQVPVVDAGALFNHRPATSPLPAPPVAATSATDVYGPTADAQDDGTTGASRGYGFMGITTPQVSVATWPYFAAGTAPAWTAPPSLTPQHAQQSQSQASAGAGGECSASGLSFNGIGSMASIGQPQAIFQVGVGSPLGLHVSQQTKEKIWQGAFVDFSLLCHDTSISANIIDKYDSASSDLSLVVEQGKLVLRKPGVSRKKIESVDVWQSAFHTFMAIFLQKHPFRSAELLKYAEIIRLAANQFPGHGWRLYDEQFRLKLEMIPTRPWGNLDMELWLTVAAAGVAPPAAPGSTWSSSFAVQQVNKSKPANFKSRVCFAFNNGQGCFGRVCKFAHQCSKCSSTGHGAYQCRMGQVGGQARGVNSAPYSWVAHQKPRAHATKASTSFVANPKPSSSVRSTVGPVTKGDNAHSFGGGASSFRASNAN